MAQRAIARLVGPRFLKRWLPKTLWGRSFLIIVLPIGLMQLAVAWYFLNPYWRDVTESLSDSLAGDIAAVVQDYLLSNDYFAPVLDRIVLRFRLLTLFQVPRERLLLLLTANADILNDVHARMMTQHGSIEQYLTAACRIDPATLERLRSRLLA